MLVAFKFSNFKSFRDEQVFSMVANSDRASLPENLIDTVQFGDRQLVRSSVLYGANAAGKSNFVEALAYVKFMVTRSHRLNPESGTNVAQFAFGPDGVSRATSSFELSFYHKDVRYEFGFTVDPLRITDEWLYAYPVGRRQVWYERTYNVTEKLDAYRFGRNLTGENERTRELVKNNTLFLSVAAQYNHPMLTRVREWFSHKLGVFEHDDNQFMRNAAVRALAQSKKDQAVVVSFLKLADLGINDIQIESSSAESMAARFLTSTEEDGEPPESIKLARELLRAIAKEDPQSNTTLRLVHDAGPLVPARALALEDESEGTRQLLGLSTIWPSALEDDRVVVIDELDTSLHPHILRELVRAFHKGDEGTAGAQLIFNTHDATILDQELFRRDQIWFVEKDRTGASQMYPLTDYRPRKDEAVGKRYLEGRYGAIPFVGDLGLISRAGPGASEETSA